MTMITYTNPIFSSHSPSPSTAQAISPSSLLKVRGITIRVNNQFIPVFIVPEKFTFEAAPFSSIWLLHHTSKPLTSRLYLSIEIWYDYLTEKGGASYG